MLRIFYLYFTTAAIAATAVKLRGSDRLKVIAQFEWSENQHRMETRVGTFLDDSPGFPVDRMLKLFLENEDATVLLLHGDAASGKTDASYILETACLSDVKWIVLRFKLSDLCRALKNSEAQKLAVSMLWDAYGITVEQLQQHVLFIVDGYDEIGLPKNYNIFYEAGLARFPGAKLFVTCWSQYLIDTPEYRLLFQSIPIRRSGSFQEYFLLPMSNVVLLKYLTPVLMEPDLSELLARLQSSMELRALLAYPMFILSMAKHLPSIIAKRRSCNWSLPILSVDIYELAFNDFIHQLLEQNMHGGYLKSEHDIARKIQETAQQQAWAILEKQSSQRESPIFVSEILNKTTKSVRISRAFRSYLAMLYLWNRLMHGDTLSKVHPMLTCDLSLSTYSSVIRFFSDKMLSCAVNNDNSSVMITTLFRIITENKSSGPANSMTILAATGISLSGRDFSNINAKSVILRNALLENTNFNHALLAYSDLRGAKLKNTTFDGANLTHTRFADKPLVEVHDHALIRKMLSCERQFSNQVIVLDAETVFWYQGTGRVQLLETLQVLQICTAQYTHQFGYCGYYRNNCEERCFCFGTADLNVRSCYEVAHEVLHIEFFMLEGSPVLGAAVYDTVFVFDPKTNQLRHCFKFSTGVVDNISFNSDGTLVGVVSQGRVFQSLLAGDFAAATAAPLFFRIDMEKEAQSVTFIRFSPIHQSVIAMVTGTNIILRKEDKQQCRLQGHQNVITMLSWSADGSILASSCGVGIRLWDVGSGSMRGIVHCGMINSMWLDPAAIQVYYVTINPKRSAGCVYIFDVRDTLIASVQTLQPFTSNFDMSPVSLNTCKQYPEKLLFNPLAHILAIQVCVLAGHSWHVWFIPFVDSMSPVCYLGRVATSDNRIKLLLGQKESLVVAKNALSQGWLQIPYQKYLIQVNGTPKVGILEQKGDITCCHWQSKFPDIAF